MSREWWDGFWLGLEQFMYGLSVLCVGASVGMSIYGHPEFIDHPWWITPTWIGNAILWRLGLHWHYENAALASTSEKGGRG